MAPTAITITDNDRNPDSLDDGSGNGFGTGRISQTFSGDIDGTVFTDSPINIENTFNVFDSNGVLLGQVYDTHVGNLTGAFGIVSTFELQPDTTYTIVRVSSAPTDIDPATLFVCFTRGTMIETPRGLRAIQDLRVGDVVLTRDGGPQPIGWIGSRKTAAEGDAAPVRFSKGAFGLKEDLLLSQSHRVMLTDWRAEAMLGASEVLATARQLLDGDRVFIDRSAPEVEYYHFMFDRHHVVRANGLEVESLFVGDAAMDSLGAASREEIFSVFPELRSNSTALGAPARPILKSSEVRVLSAL
ncbi:MAG: Hint domain-containing protein [Pseudomonadota bacterium]